MFELRFYSVSGGRLADEIKRMFDVAIAGAPVTPKGPPTKGPTLWEEHGLPKPIGAWTVSAGRGLPGLIYMMNWDSMEQRDRAFPSFWRDERWLSIREAGEEGSPLVDRYEDWLLTPSPAWATVRDRDHIEAVGGLHELRIQQVRSRAVEEAEAALATIDLQHAKRHGARVLGVFQVAIGPNCPCLITFLSWPDYEVQREASSKFEADPEVLRQRESQLHPELGALFCSSEHYLLDPISWGLPSSNFGMFR